MSNGTNEIRGCEVCGNHNLTPVLDLGAHPMCDDLVKIGDSRRCSEYPIEILFCETCRTAHQRFQVPKQELFPATYHYRSRFTADVINGMSQLVASCESRYGSLAGKRVVDVGCNDGSLLNFFRDRGATTFGIEPTGAYVDAQEQGHTVYNTFLSEDGAAQIRAAHGAPHFIVFTNVFAHIENLPAVIRSLLRLIDRDTVLVIENHYLGAVLDGNQFDTFYHEHPRTYSYTSFVHIAKSLGVALTDVEFPARYGGNIRVYLGASSEGRAGAGGEEVEARERGFLKDFETLRRNMDRWRSRKKETIEDAVRRHGALRAKAFPGRAAILMKLLDLDERSISAVHEKPGSMKIGHYVPGTRIPILSDDELFRTSSEDKLLLNLAWHIPGEIRSYLTKHGYKTPVLDIVSVDDFR